MLVSVNLPTKHLVLCSPNARNVKLFGNATYVSEKLNNDFEKLISSINEEQNIPDNFLTKSLGKIQKNQTLVFACTEVSMQAAKEGLFGIDTLKILIQRIVKEL